MTPGMDGSWAGRAAQALPPKGPISEKPTQGNLGQSSVGTGSIELGSGSRWNEEPSAMSPVSVRHILLTAAVGIHSWTGRICEPWNTRGSREVLADTKTGVVSTTWLDNMDIQCSILKASCGISKATWNGWEERNSV